MDLKFRSILILLMLYFIMLVFAGGKSDTDEEDDDKQCSRKNERCSSSEKNVCCFGRCKKRKCQCSKKGKQCITKRECCKGKSLDCIEGKCQASSSSENANGPCANAGQSCGGPQSTSCCNTGDILRCQYPTGANGNPNAIGSCVRSCKQLNETCGGIAGFQCCAGQNLVCNAPPMCCDFAGKCVQKA